MPGRKPGSVRKKEQPVENTSFRYCGKPDKEQQLLLNRTLGACRWLHNRMLSDRKAMYEQCGDQEKRSPAWYKHLMPYGTWLKDTDSSALANEELHLNRAYENFFAGRAGYPKFRKKSDHHDSYTTSMTNGNIRCQCRTEYSRRGSQTCTFCLIYRKVPTMTINQCNRWDSGDSSHLSTACVHRFMEAYPL